MTIEDAVTFLSDPSVPLRVVYHYVPQLLPKLGEPALLRLSAVFSPSRPCIQQLFVQFAVFVNLALTLERDLDHQPDLSHY